jgi:protein-disulfide isomerase
MTSTPFRTAAAAALTLALAACDKSGSAPPTATGGGGSEAVAAQRPAPASTAARDWTKVVTTTPEGGFLMGNPNAKVKLLEFASTTCPHCQRFWEAAHKPLVDDYVKSGRVSYEYRTFVLNGPDYAMSVLARCQGAQAFFPLLDQIYATQTQWMQPFLQPDPTAQAKISASPADKQLLAVADTGKLDQFYKLRGVPRAKYEACLTDKAQQKPIEDIRETQARKYNVTGTPTFFVNGEMLGSFEQWAPVEAAIKAKLG